MPNENNGLFCLLTLASNTRMVNAKIKSLNSKLWMTRSIQFYNTYPPPTTSLMEEERDILTSTLCSSESRIVW